MVSSLLKARSKNRKTSRPVYGLVKGSRIKKSLAQPLGEELAKIRKNRGTLTPSIIVEEAMKNPNGILHGQFQWSDKKAAVEWRIEQAKYILRSIEVQIEEGKVFRAFVNVPIGSNTKERHYVPIKNALNNEISRDWLLQTAMRELVYFRHKYATLKELTNVFEAIDKAVKKKSKK